MLQLQSRHPPRIIRRWRWRIAGQVQGVGFRPFVYRAARELHLSGFVRNDTSGVTFECQGDEQSLRRFEQTLAHPPACAVVRQIDKQIVDIQAAESDFRISDSHPGSVQSVLNADVAVDTAACPDCVREILSRDDRRHGYALTNCTHCGPRFSIIRRVPYDRCNTTMASFEMCPTCAAEYAEPTDRRFHAQPIACHDCGPTLQLVDSHGQAIAGDPIRSARRMLLAGRIVAIKGLGGFHLAVRADDERAVLRLRKLKKREHKPFAIMVSSLKAARELVALSESAAKLATSPSCPIVLAPRRAKAQIAPSVAGKSHRLGVMLPYTPIHHLLFAATRPIPSLVMTSGNVSDDPLVTDNADALLRLGPLCDAILWHDRPIERGVDDSVVSDIGRGDPTPLRRARGYVPSAIPLPVSDRTRGLSVGAELKNTVAVVRDGSAILSQHLGDLVNPRAFDSFRKTIVDLQKLFDVRPQWIAHDMHPMYLSTAHANNLAASSGVPLIAVQHHHAHAASVMAENGVTEKILAVVCDGTGYGTDETIWGGELLLADLRTFKRVAHLRTLRLPGGDAAARDTTRSALALLYQAYGDEFESIEATRRLIPDSTRRSMLCRMIQGDISCPRSSGAGRIFDGVAAILGLCQRNRFEAEAAMSLESAAHRSHAFEGDNPKLYSIEQGDCVQIDFAPLVLEILDRQRAGENSDDLAYLFHEQFARAWAHVTTKAAERFGIRTVGLSGGVFCNAILTLRLIELLEASGLRVLRHRIVPPNDGGIALGQAAIAAARRAANPERAGA